MTTTNKKSYWLKCERTGRITRIDANSYILALDVTDERGFEESVHASGGKTALYGRALDMIDDANAYDSLQEVSYKGEN